MKKSVLLTLLPVAFAFAANAETFLVDLNTTESGTYPGGSSAWNAFAAPVDVNGSALNNSSGLSTSGITLSYTGTMQDSTRNASTATLTNPGLAPSWVGNATDTAASSDYFWTSNSVADASFTLTFGGLNTGDKVSLDLWTSRDDTPSGGNYEYSLDSGATWFGFNVLKSDGSAETAAGWDSEDTQSQLFNNQSDGNVAGRYMNVGDVTIGASKTLSVRVSDPDGATAGYYAVASAMQLVVIPEPSTSAAILGLLVFSLPLIRRKR
jgi:hypothetical protein